MGKAEICDIAFLVNLFLCAARIDLAACQNKGIALMFRTYLGKMWQIGDLTKLINSTVAWERYQLPNKPAKSWIFVLLQDMDKKFNEKL